MKQKLFSILLVFVLILSFATNASAKNKYDPSVDDIFDDVTTEIHTHTQKTTTVKPTYFKKGYKLVTCEECFVQISKTSIAKLNLSNNQFKLISGKKHFKVNYKKIPYAKGFQVRYKINGKWKYKIFNASKTCTKKLENIKKGKYIVSIRGWKFNKGKKIYTKWSDSKKVTVK